MVFLSRLFRLPIKLDKGGTLFNDFLSVYVRGGKGGNGLASAGGVGGDGGDVYLEAMPKTTLTKMRIEELTRFVAQSGRRATRVLIIGDKGKDLVVNVPLGVTVETPSRKLLGSLNKKGERLLVAKGAEGGSAKTRFEGQHSIPHMLHLHLKLIADIGFVGFPNAGKSTLLKALSRTDPLISAFPFTTVRPQIGTMVFEDYRSISLADLPGLIEGAHLNKGMGHKFLKHVERTLLLLFIVDLNGFQLSIDDQYRNAYETIILLNKELEMYNPALLDKPAVLLINKMDTDHNYFKFNKLLKQLEKRREDKTLPQECLPTKFIEFMDTIPVCAKDRDSTEELKSKLRNYLDLIDLMKRKQMDVDDKTIQLYDADEMSSAKSLI